MHIMEYLPAHLRDQPVHSWPTIWQERLAKASADHKADKAKDDIIPPAWLGE